MFKVKWETTCKRDKDQKRNTFFLMAITGTHMEKHPIKVHMDKPKVNLRRRRS